MKYYFIILVTLTGSRNYYSTADGWKEFFNFEEEAAVTIVALPLPFYGGVINGRLQYNYDENASITAQGNMGYDFQGWMENNQIVSTNREYTFIIDGPHTLYAVFTPRENADENIQIQAQARSASISWVAVEDAANYSLVIYSDESRTQEIARFQLDANGNILRNSTRALSCTVPDLDTDTQYFYSLTSYDAGNQALTISAGNFTTSASDAISNITVSDPVIAIQYYDFIGRVVVQPQQGRAYIVKEVHQSGKVEVRKEIYR